MGVVAEKVGDAVVAVARRRAPSARAPRRGGARARKAARVAGARRARPRASTRTRMGSRTGRSAVARQTAADRARESAREGRARERARGEIVCVDSMARESATRARATMGDANGKKIPAHARGMILTCAARVILSGHDGVTAREVADVMRRTTCERTKRARWWERTGQITRGRRGAFEDVAGRERGGGGRERRWRVRVDATRRGRGARRRV